MCVLVSMAASIRLLEEAFGGLALVESAREGGDFLDSLTPGAAGPPLSDRRAEPSGASLSALVAE
jgi:hypothetical protein